MDRLMGPLLVTLSTFSYALMFPLLKRINEKIQPFNTMAISMFILFFCSLVLSIIFEGGPQNIKPATLKAYLPWFLIAGMVNVFAFWFEILGYKYMPLWQQTMFTLLTPIFAGIASYFILGESINPKLFVGLLVMGIGLYIAIR